MYRIATFFKLGWCKVIDAKSGWVSDNYVAYYLLVKWIYHPINTFEGDTYVKHSTPGETCNKDACIKWINRYGFNYEQGLEREKYNNDT